jgi:hypothetical protein
VSKPDEISQEAWDRMPEDERRSIELNASWFRRASAAPTDKQFPGTLPMPGAHPLSEEERQALASNASDGGAMFRVYKHSSGEDSLRTDITRAVDQSETRAATVSDEVKFPDLPGTKTLDYLGLGLLLATPAVVVDMFIRGVDIDWRKVAIAAIGTCASGGIAVWASHKWQTWRTSNNRLLPYLAAFESRFWGKAIIVAIAIGFALALSSVLSPRPSEIASPTATPTADDIARATAPLKAQLEAAHAQIAELQKTQQGFFNAGPPEQPTTEKIIVDVSPDYLMNLYENKMSSEGDRLFAPYAGKWMSLTETVSDVSAGNSVIAFSKAPNGAYRTIDMFFDAKLADRLAILTRDQKISVLCQIWDGSDVNIRFRHCEFGNL